MADYVSQIKAIVSDRTSVYNKLSDLSGLAGIGEKLKETEVGKVEIEAIDSDSCAFIIPKAGRLVFRIVEREPEKTIKLEAEASPIPLTMWIQLLEPQAGDTRLRLTIRTELNFMMKKMIGGKLQEGVDRLADMMAMIPYQKS